uniref:Uncharacterized protein n=1 Tax=Lepeophtheirus salmonis TaxID=72036 RepID=A0A0K2V240_LEPSM
MALGRNGLRQKYRTPLYSYPFGYFLVVKADCSASTSQQNIFPLGLKWCVPDPLFLSQNTLKLPL